MPPLASRANINVDAGRGPEPPQRDVEQCAIVSEYNDLNLKLRQAAGGPTTWIKLPRMVQLDDIALDVPIEVYVSTDISPTGINSYAWSNYNYEQEECA